MGHFRRTYELQLAYPATFYDAGLCGVRDTAHQYGAPHAGLRPVEPPVPAVKCQ
jgi:hypothetical protein